MPARKVLTRKDGSTYTAPGKAPNMVIRNRIARELLSIAIRLDPLPDVLPESDEACLEYGLKFSVIDRYIYITDTRVVRYQLAALARDGRILRTHAEFGKGTKQCHFWPCGALELIRKKRKMENRL